MTKVFARLRVVLVVVAMAVSCASAQSAKPITDWLVCGPFPFERGLSQFLADYLTEHGGEANIRPKEGMTHSVKGLGKVSWQRHSDTRRCFGFCGADGKASG
jgi:hypothetical protein